VPHPHPDPADAELTAGLLEGGDFAAAVLDGYHLDACYQHRLRALGRCLLVIDDTAHLERYEADILLNQNLRSDELVYRTAGEPRRLLGARYALLRREFAPWQQHERAFQGPAQRLLLTVGGSAQDELLQKILRAVTPLGLEVRVAAQTSPAEMPELMAWADVALTAAGSTCWELAFMGVPLAVFVLADNQARNASGLAALGAAAFLGTADDLSDERLAAELGTLVADEARRRSMSAAGRALVDGRGAGRVVAAIAGEES
jgi:UDP-2,4-diacetamido-2,4,6-trideoxy-beta-L-altropyranose hydrolase